MARIMAIVVLATCFTVCSAAQEEPKDSPSFTRLGIMTIRAGRFEEGIKHLDRAILLDKDNSLAYYWRGKAGASMGNYQEAIKDFDMVVKLDPAEPTAYLERAHAKSALQDLAGAKADLDKAYELQPSLKEPPKEIKLAKAVEKPAPPEKKEEKKEANRPVENVKKDGETPEKREPVNRPEPVAAKKDKSKELPLAERMGRMIQLPEADLIAEQYLQFARTRLLAIQLGLASWTSAEAKATYTKYYQEILSYTAMVIEINPNDASAYVVRGAAKGRMKENQAAIEDHNKALKISPRYPEAYFYRGIAKHQANDDKGAFEDLEEAIRINPQYADAYFVRGEIKRIRGDHTGAVTEWTKAIDLNPKHFLAYGNRGVMKFKRGDDHGAIKDLAKALELYSQSASFAANAYYNLGLAKNKIGDYKGALTDFEKAVELEPARKAQADRYISDLRTKLKK